MRFLSIPFLLVPVSLIETVCILVPWTFLARLLWGRLRISRLDTCMFRAALSALLACSSTIKCSRPRELTNSSQGRTHLDYKLLHTIFRFTSPHLPDVSTTLYFCPGLT